MVEQSNRLDKFLAAEIKEFSRTQLQKAVQSGVVKVNGNFVTKPGFKLRKNDRVTVSKEKLISLISGQKKKFVVEPEEMPLNIVYEDDDILVVNKQAGLLVHPTLKHLRHTLVNGLVFRHPEIINVGENHLRPGIVHRLDKNTSGLLIAAKNQKSFLFVKEQFLKRQVEKKYLALVEGVPKNKKGTIKYPIKPSKHYRLKKIAVKKESSGKKSERLAETNYKIIKTFGAKFALLEVEPKTGRTHQIRVHLASIGHPIAGDALYGAKNEFSEKRHFLHAYYLKFILPNGSPIALETDLPEDLRKFLEGLNPQQ
ncbi:MAG: Pseudouridine synthase [Candidatus Curtissbacteria bacterium GW2011_GWA1_40_24]|uniref:Pseudouridine synthase n=2 Tax=Patescibacteria group TaxID=1783273 RepID=A0A0G0RT59_9BACT|nr:MAG: Pseudouridine synthase [Candidatus Curtissbacteria bacterium GW2011_GWA1_40_24]KKR89048.1 MAG: Pseudouridine synthase [Candidatus Wolfebacteria bacterium GW2011_GWB1_41_12]